jgi:HSP20 family protein
MKTSLVRNPSRGLQSSWYNPFDRFFRNDLLNLWEDEDLSTVPSINITEEKESYKIEMAAPGLKKEDFNIEVDGNMMTISSEKESEKNEPSDNGNGKRNYSRREYNYSCFSRSFTLPEDTDLSKVSAKYNDGILNVTVQKSPETKQKTEKKIEVQ